MNANESIKKLQSIQQEIRDMKSVLPPYKTTGDEDFEPESIVQNSLSSAIERIENAIFHIGTQASDLEPRPTEAAFGTVPF